MAYESKRGKCFFKFFIILFFHPIAVNTNHILRVKKHSLHVEADLLTYKGRDSLRNYKHHSQSTFLYNHLFLLVVVVFSLFYVAIRKIWTLLKLTLSHKDCNTSVLAFQTAKWKIKNKQIMSHKQTKDKKRWESMLALITYPSAIEDRCRTFKPFLYSRWGKSIYVVTALKLANI